MLAQADSKLSHLGLIQRERLGVHIHELTGEHRIRKLGIGHGAVLQRLGARFQALNGGVGGLESQAHGPLQCQRRSELGGKCRGLRRRDDALELIEGAGQPSVPSSPTEHDTSRTARPRAITPMRGPSPPSAASPRRRRNATRCARRTTPGRRSAPTSSTHARRRAREAVEREREQLREALAETHQRLAAQTEARVQAEGQIERLERALATAERARTAAETESRRSIAAIAARYDTLVGTLAALRERLDQLESPPRERKP